jgi:hypothetical protein
MQKNIEVNFLKSLLKDSSYSTKKAHDIIYDLHLNDSQAKSSHLTPIALTHYNKAFTTMASAKLYYFTNQEILENNEVEQIFEAFDLFSNEYLEALEDESSIQHIHLYFSDYYSAVTELLG